MTEHRLRWSAQARLMRHDIVETPVSRAGVSSLLWSCWEDGKSFIPVSGVRRESVSHTSGTVCVFRAAECVVVRICGCVCVVASVWFFYNNMPALLAFLKYINIYSYIQTLSIYSNHIHIFKPYSYIQTLFIYSSLVHVFKHFSCIQTLFIHSKSMHTFKPG